MTYPTPPYTLFQIMDGIVGLKETGPSNREILESTDLITEYAEGACNTEITPHQAKGIKEIGKRWLFRLETGDETDETCERWAENEISPYETANQL